MLVKLTLTVLVLSTVAMDVYAGCYCVTGSGVRLYRTRAKSDIIGLAYPGECYPDTPSRVIDNLIELRVSGRHPNMNVWSSFDYWDYTRPTC